MLYNGNPIFVNTLISTFIFSAIIEAINFHFKIEKAQEIIDNRIKIL